MKSFEELGLSNDLLKVIKEMNFDEPSEIQEKVIPLAMSGNDIIGESATGSGKTLAFGAPIIENIKTGQHKVRVVARNKAGTEADRTHEFGINEDWKEPTPIATTTPTPSPTSLLSPTTP